MYTASSINLDRYRDNLSARRQYMRYAMIVVMIALVMRAVYLQVLSKDFLQNKGDRQYLESMPVTAYRGQIRDRNGEPLAISAPVQSIWINGSQIKENDWEKIDEMARILSLPEQETRSLIKKQSKKKFFYLKRQINPSLAEQISALNINGVYVQREFKRYYPAGAVSAHLLGFTNIDDQGQEGLELEYNQRLQGAQGAKRVIKDGKGRVVQEVENISEAVPGQDLALTIDERIQYLAFRELLAAMRDNQAKSASLVVLDAKNGDVLAAASQPTFNPNNRKDYNGESFRNRSMVDSFEPGSTVKPFVVAAALDGGYVRPDAVFETHGVYHLGRNVVKDVHNYGFLDLTHVLTKSSNIAVTQIAMRIPPKEFWSVYKNLGFGSGSMIGFPGEASGALLDYQNWHEFDQATLSFGYGVSTSLLQLARAYTALADDGVVHSLSLLQRDEDPEQRRLFKPETARRVREMLEQVTGKEGTAYLARVEGYRVAGKTGTVKKAIKGGGYSEDKYLSVFVGMAPASAPRFIVAVVVDEPSAGHYYGGQVAAPVFSKVMGGVLRMYGVEPDGLENMRLLVSKR